MSNRKTFAAVETLEDLNRVNDAQKDSWIEADKLTGGALFKERQLAYLQRWLEAAVHIPNKAVLLDIGGGWPIESIWAQVISRKELKYHAVDIHEGQIDATKEFLRRYGAPDCAAKVGTNTKLDFDDGYFDVVHSSHCLEHSPDLSETFREITRVLKRGGTLLFSVPFGFDDSDEHLLFFDIEEWLHAAEFAGFEILNYHVGKTYGVHSWDLLVVAKFTNVDVNANALETLSAKFSKVGRSLVKSTDEIFTYGSGHYQSGEHAILSGIGAEVVINQVEPIKFIIFFRHTWSGVAEISDGSRSETINLWSRMNYMQAIDISNMNGPIRITVRGGKDDKQQAVIFGVLL